MASMLGELVASALNRSDILHLCAQVRAEHEETCVVGVGAE